MILNIVLFAAAAVFGLVIFINWLKEKDAPTPVVYMHGLTAAIALVMLIYYAVQHPDNYPMVSLILFAVGAVGGFYLFYLDQVKKQKPVGITLAMLHAGIGVVAFVMLIIFAMG